MRGKWIAAAVAAVLGSGMLAAAALADGPPLTLTIVSGRVGTPTITPLFSSTDAQASFRCRFDAAPFADCVSGTVYHPGEGPHTFELYAVDTSGVHSQTYSAPFTIDTTPPTTVFTSGPPERTVARTASIAFGADEKASFECSLDGAAFAACTSPYAAAGLADGTHALRVKASDGLNEGAPATRTWTVDNAPPQLTITSGPGSGAHSGAVAAFTFTSDEAATFACRLDAAAFAPCASGIAYADLPAGPHAFTVRATDLVGNAAEASREWTVDDTPVVVGAAPTPTPTPTPVAPAAPKPAVTFSLSYSAKAGRTTTFTHLLVKGAPAGATIRLTCHGTCAKPTVTLAHPTAGAVSLTRYLKTGLRPGTTLTVSVTKPGLTSASMVLRVRAGRRPALSTTMRV